MCGNCNEAIWFLILLSCCGGGCGCGCGCNNNSGTYANNGCMNNSCWWLFWLWLLLNGCCNNNCGNGSGFFGGCGGCR